jgi:hypothetical protein
MAVVETVIAAHAVTVDLGTTVARVKIAATVAPVEIAAIAARVASAKAVMKAGASPNSLRPS